jgi:hypothetical protein
MSDGFIYTLWGIGGYLLGSIPFGLVLCYLAGYGDIRKIGSGNIGATNVLRTGNKLLAILTLLLDAFKAGIAAWMAYKFVNNTTVMFFGLVTSTNILASLDGADITTFFAPPFKCADAFSVVVNTPDDSTTYSTPTSPQGISEGSIQLNTFTVFPFIIKSFPSIFISALYFP